MSVAVQLYHALFEVRSAQSPADLQAVYRLRYQVYCLEKGYEASKEEPIEKDIFDEHALHSLLIFKPTGTVVGTARIVLPKKQNKQNSYPLQKVCDHPLLKDPKMISNYPELSRFAISKEGREHVLKNEAFQKTITQLALTKKEAIQAVFSCMCVGLIGYTVRACVHQGFRGVFAVLEPSLLRLLSRVGISGKKLGGVVAYHGKRQPCIFDKDFFDMDAEDGHALMRHILTENNIDEAIDVTDVLY